MSPRDRLTSAPPRRWRGAGSRAVVDGRPAPASGRCCWRAVRSRPGLAAPSAHRRAALGRGVRRRPGRAAVAARGGDTRARRVRRDVRGPRERRRSAGHAGGRWVRRSGSWATAARCGRRCDVTSSLSGSPRSWCSPPTPRPVGPSPSTSAWLAASAGHLAVVAGAARSGGDRTAGRRGRRRGADPRRRGACGGLGLGLGCDAPRHARRLARAQGRGRCRLAAGGDSRGLDGQRPSVVLAASVWPRRGRRGTCRGRRRHRRRWAQTLRRGAARASRSSASLPNLVLWAVAWLPGPGFAVGAGTPSPRTRCRRAAARPPAARCPADPGRRAAVLGAGRASWWSALPGWWLHRRLRGRRRRQPLAASVACAAAPPRSSPGLGGCPAARRARGGWPTVGPRAGAGRAGGRRARAAGPAAGGPRVGAGRARRGAAVVPAPARGAVEAVRAGEDPAARRVAQPTAGPADLGARGEAVRRPWAAAAPNRSVTACWYSSGRPPGPRSSGLPRHCWRSTAAARPRASIRSSGRSPRHRAEAHDDRDESCRAAGPPDGDEGPGPRPPASRSLQGDRRRARATAGRSASRVARRPARGC